MSMIPWDRGLRKTERLRFVEELLAAAEVPLLRESLVGRVAAWNGWAEIGGYDLVAEGLAFPFPSAPNNRFTC